jgi:thiol-disulfide isomerase/thioredoxin
MAQKVADITPWFPVTLVTSLGARPVPESGGPPDARRFGAHHYRRDVTRRSTDGGRKRPFGAVAVAAALTLGLAACTGGGGSNAGPGDTTGDTVAANPFQKGQVVDATFTTLDGGSRSFTDYRGRPVVVNFFSTSCQPCNAEMPALEAVKAQRGSTVAWVGLDEFDTPERTRAMVSRTGVSWDIGRDLRGALFARLGGTGLPITLVLDRSGTLIYSFAGTMVHNLGDLTTALDQATASP